MCSFVRSLARTLAPIFLSSKVKINIYEENLVNCPTQCLDAVKSSTSIIIGLFSLRGELISPTALIRPSRSSMTWQRLLYHNLRSNILQNIASSGKEFTILLTKMYFAEFHSVR
ncbi:hypothetical protein CRM22_010686 [Opisthorchis felineus]|uniref:Uncharacterized protein n=1 Tax=Opisthorchis felineus TaxID=147828 RepID=A0A4S2KR52_OPIFE|nr:hypothetical protein CRM22_010686 [Opisthorchis felineus]TGZ52140.1 hypothetical protein CRM22_010686 [Opisthorchis felineus]